MGDVPDTPKLYHITHVDNLPVITQHGCLWSDGRRQTENCRCKIVGMTAIKRRRLEELEVACHPGTKVGQYVPFYFCPRSIMLYLLHRGNHPDLDYDEGQNPVVHLQADLRETVDWAQRNNRSWAFSDRNAGTRYAFFYNDIADIEKLNWDAIEAITWRDSLVKDGKQAEFLVLDSFPWELVEKIGVIDKITKIRVEKMVENSSHKPLVEVERSWYY